MTRTHLDPPLVIDVNPWRGPPSGAGRWDSTTIDVATRIARIAGSSRNLSLLIDQSRVTQADVPDAAAGESIDAMMRRVALAVLADRSPSVTRTTINGMAGQVQVLLDAAQATCVQLTSDAARAVSQAIGQVRRLQAIGLLAEQAAALGHCVTALTQLVFTGAEKAPLQ